MDYLTQYYKNRSEELQEELNHLNSLKPLNENVFDDAYYLIQQLYNQTFGKVGARNPITPGSLGPKPGVRPPTRTPFDWQHNYRKPIMPPAGLDPGHPLPPGKGRPTYYPPSQMPGLGNGGGWPTDQGGYPYSDQQRPGGPGFGPWYPLQ